MSQLSLCTHNPDHALYNSFSISVQFFHPNGPSIFLVSTIHQVIWPSPDTLMLTIWISAVIELLVILNEEIRGWDKNTTQNSGSRSDLNPELLLQLKYDFSQQFAILHASPRRVLQCSVLQCVAVSCTVLQYVAVCCRVCCHFAKYAYLRRVLLFGELRSSIPKVMRNKLF